MEDDHPGLLKAIVHIATYGSGADERRRSDSIRTIKTLDELTTELQKQGFEVVDLNLPKTIKILIINLSIRSSEVGFI